MPFHNHNLAQRQGRIFHGRLTNELNPSHKLYKFRKVINWDALERNLAPLLKTYQSGRNRKAPRIMIGLLLLQKMYKLSDKATSEMLEENMYWQYFCGYEYVMDKHMGVSESCIRRFRQELGEEGLQLILSALVDVGLNINVIKKEDLETIIVDTTVQTKNIKYPIDKDLLARAYKELIAMGKRLTIKFHETYNKKFKKHLYTLRKYKHDSKAKIRKKAMKSMKTLLGRLIGYVSDQIEELNYKLTPNDQQTLEKIRSIHKQSFLSAEEKKAYKKEGNKVLYSFHESHVECIGKGKVNKRFEFGNKNALTLSGQGNMVLGVLALHGNPYDGHTLDQSIKVTEKITGYEVKQSTVDQGYKGHNYAHKSRVFTPNTKKEITPKIKKLQQRRNAIEPIIGHMKRGHGGMERNFLKGKIGDTLNALLSAIGQNMRCLGNALRALE